MYIFTSDFYKKLFMEQPQIPAKPFFEEKQQNHLTYSIVSFFLFVGAFYLFFSKDIKFIIILTTALFIHELGHFFAMKIFGYKELKLFFIPLLGALVSGKKDEISQRRRSLILLAGPIPGIIIGIILLFTAHFTQNQDLVIPAYIFIFFNTFNLLPILPLDGGNFLFTLFLNKKDNLQIIFTVISMIGFLVIAIFLKEYILLVIPFFMLIRFVQMRDRKKIVEILDREKINYNKTFNDLTDEEYWKIREYVVTNIKVFNNVNAKDYSVSKQEKQIKSIIESLLEPSSITEDLSNQSKVVFIILWLLFLIAPLAIIYFLM